MKIHKKTLNDFGYLYIEDVFKKHELKYISQEILNMDWIMDNLERIKEERLFNSAHDENDNPMMTGNGVFIDDIYYNKDCSAALTYNRKIFQEEIKEAMESTHPANVCVNLTNFDATSLNRYNKGEKYSPHLDNSVLTCITFLSLDDKEMQGGDFVFTDYNIKFKFKNNSAVYFPSWVKHHCTEIESDATRYSLAQFVSIR